jgi:hypothetical protein
MSKGNFTATAASAIIVAADDYRDYLTIQKGTNAVAMALGIGEAAVAGEGIQLTNIDDSVELWGVDARAAIYGIGNTAAGTWEGSRVRYRPGPTPSA